MSGTIKNIKSIKVGCEYAVQVIDQIININNRELAENAKITLNNVINKCDGYLEGRINE